jgi:hypothetical protein
MNREKRTKEGKTESGESHRRKERETKISKLHKQAIQPNKLKK